MPPKQPKSGASKQATRRSTRAASVASSVASRREGTIYQEPAPEPLPGLFSRHDGSYGINTFENLHADSIHSRSASKRKAKRFMSEAEEDDRFMRTLSSNQSDHGMEDSRALGLKSQIEDIRQGLHTLEEELIDDENALDTEEYVSDIEAAEESLGPFAKPALPIKRRDVLARRLDTPKITPRRSLRYPSEPPSSLTAKFGIPAGRASSVPLSPRPDTSRSFNQESVLFGDASVFTPQPTVSFKVSPPRDQQQNILPELKKPEYHPKEPEPRPKIQQTKIPEAKKPEPKRHEPKEPEPKKPETKRPEPQPKPIQFDAPPSPIDRFLVKELETVISTEARKNAKDTTPKAPRPTPLSEVQVPDPDLDSPGPGPNRTPRPFPPGGYNLGDCSNCNWLWWMLVAFLCAFFSLYGTMDMISHGGPRWMPRVAQFIPDTVLHPLRMLGDADSKSLFGKLDSAASNIRLLEALTQNQDKKIKGLEKELSQLLHIDVDKNGKPKIPSDFWYALKDLMATGDVTSPLKSSKGSKPQISDEYWYAIQERISKSGSKEWSVWLQKNKDEVSKILGPSLTQQLSAKTEKELKGHVEKLLKSPELAGTVVTHKEFAKLMQKELASQGDEYRQQLREAEARIKEFKKSLEQVQKSPPQGMDQQDLNNMVNAAIRKAITDAGLVAAAKAGMRSHLAQSLDNQVNYFAGGNGAVIDPQYSSKPWEGGRLTFMSKKWFQRDGYKLKQSVTALRSWRDEGDCFCTLTKKGTAKADVLSVAVLVARRIIPRYFVVEHILPGATLDPDSMPKNIEVWASFEELGQRQRVADWSKRRFSDAASQKSLDASFVKIGDFTYERIESGDGTQVFRMDTELEKMAAVTNHIVVRALDNYGADHTCFYRLRMYGEERKRP